MKKYFLHLLSKNGHQQFVNSEPENNRKLVQLQREGWIVEQTKEFTDLEAARREKDLLLQSFDLDGRMIV